MEEVFENITVLYLAKLAAKFGKDKILQACNYVATYNMSYMLNIIVCIRNYVIIFSIVIVLYPYHEARLQSSRKSRTAVKH